MPQTVATISTSLIRLVFRGGSPERIRYSDRLLIVGLLGTVLATVASEHWFFEHSLLQTGLLLFTLFTGVYLGAALLSRRVARTRLRVALQSVWLLLFAVATLLVCLTPLVRFLPDARTGIVAAAGVVVLMGMANVIQYARGTTRLRAVLTALAFVSLLGAYYTILSTLLEILFS